MSDFFSAYQPPGVYAVEETTPLAPVIGINPTVIAIVGPALGYRLYTEAVTLTGTTQVTLSKLGIRQASVTVTKADGSTAANNTDYDLTVVQGTTDPEDVTKIARDATGTLGSGEQVVVSYEYTDAAYFDPLRATSYEDVKAAFGEPIDRTSGAIISPLSFAAKFALDNGANRLVLVPTAGDADGVDVDDLKAAYAAVLAQEDVTIVVPLPVGLNGSDGDEGDVGQVGTDLKSHVEGAASDALYRVAILGFETGVSLDPGDLATEIDSKRVMLVHPNQMNYYNSFLSQTVVLPGYYLAAASAGRLSALPVQYALTRKPVRGFTGIPNTLLNTMNRTTKDAWSNAGVAVIEPSPTRGLICRHGVSTDTASVLTREISITRAQDTVIRTMMQSLDQADLIGAPITAETPARIKGIASGVLELMTAQDVIVGYSGLSVRQTSIDPTVIEVKYLYAPTYPNNYVLVTYGIDTSIGALVVNEVTENPEGA